tara:strand:+ start:1038 stop:1373 length:336 start_codon:yes stop_codon:yes gene_type:complete
MSTKTQKLFAEFDEAIMQAFTVPNDWLPEKYHNHKTGCVSLERLNKKCDKQEGITDHKKLKAEKARRIEDYRQQVAASGEFEYIDIDEHKLYKNQMAFAKYCPAINMEEEE